MKHRIISLLAAAAVLLTGCQSREVSIAMEKQNGQTAVTAEAPAQDLTGELSGGAATGEEAQVTGEAATGEEEYQPTGGSYFDDVFKGFESNGVGDYSGVDEYIRSMKAPEVADVLDSLYLVECVEPLTYKRSQELFGNKKRWWQFYEVRLKRDLMDGSEPDRTVYIRRSMSAEYQLKGFPAYAPGEQFLLLLSDEADGYCQVSGSGMLDYDVYDEDGTLWAYSRDCRTFDESIPGCEKIDEDRVTSTTQNPAHYTGRLTLDALTAYMQELFRDNGLTRHFRQTAP